ncbi:efflux RND transporter periplasmic adaptor subunit [Myroides odoratimimus]|uniref:efflux RND transporter periplasmic adaptor subunit n=1 Tax=Myroides odoratimimus TaxID=76832 RepID=UPI0010402573|nr:efflux RND transporter periplasmic adaptor subunit [Myroides odoratimimus]MDM1397773.1 efflux RND transporter periplasmic adaptor subunit [Myroides odoratimimus]MDM1495580.1 efflux RND transporter periplasmic adaptor subunit [Myroides odoratimimus]MDM1529164.1 efflux RND transporter periplasmic adaptor subunit [Myroides odoratimimus]QBK76713.1 efflux RND transporter periplasmic adaptor subunit [Myroides odoratimimus]WHT72124.1 efflux RND transporter periplasmic adaptor subunit [Myroides odo
MITSRKTVLVAFSALIMFGTLIGINSCNIGSSKTLDPKENALALPIIKVDTTTAITIKDYIGNIEGKVNVEIRPQVEGILEKIFVDEGAFVKEGQPLFQIDPLPYQEVLNNMIATENVEKAKLKNAKLEIDRLKPLIDNEVIAQVQLETAKSNYDIAKASLAKATAAVNSAKISLDYTIIKAPVSGYIGRMPKRIGNLVSKGDKEPLTVLSDVSEVYVYFGMSESDFLYFSKDNKKTDTASISNGHYLPDVSLILADGHEYPEKGKVDMINGQVNRTTGSISLRASFPNSKDVMRSGNTGTIKLKETNPRVILIPQEVTTSIQDKTFVYILDKEDKVKLQSIELNGVSGNNFIVSEGLHIGDRIIKTGFDKLTEGMYVKPLN